MPDTTHSTTEPITIYAKKDLLHLARRTVRTSQPTVKGNDNNALDVRYVGYSLRVSNRGATMWGAGEGQARRVVRLVAVTLGERTRAAGPPGLTAFLVPVRDDRRRTPPCSSPPPDRRLSETSCLDTPRGGRIEYRPDPAGELVAWLS